MLGIAALNFKWFHYNNSNIRGEVWYSRPSNILMFCTLKGSFHLAKLITSTTTNNNDNNKLVFGQSLRHWYCLAGPTESWCSKYLAKPVGSTGLFRWDGKWPGATMADTCRYLAWGATVVHTCAKSYIAHTANGSVAEQTTIRKTENCLGLPSLHLFLPIAFETLGPVNSARVDFIRAVGRCLSTSSGESREVSFIMLGPFHLYPALYSISRHAHWCCRGRGLIAAPSVIFCSLEITFTSGKKYLKQNRI